MLNVASEICMVKCWLLFFSDMVIFRTAVGTVGKMFAEGAFVIVFLYTAELYPTVMRFVKYLIQNFLLIPKPNASQCSIRLSKVAKIAPFRGSLGFTTLAGF